MIKPQRTIEQALSEAKHALKSAGIDLHHLEAELLLAHTLEKTREYVIGYPEATVNQELYTLYQSFIKRRIDHEPYALIVGSQEFWGRAFNVSSETLIPRPDTETLIEAALTLFKDKNQPLRIIDLGTGTGCLLLTLLAEFPCATGIGIDINENTLEIAKTNAVHLGLAKRGEFQLRSFGEDVDGRFDLVITNPPYIVSSDIASLEPNVRDYEPHRALSGGEDGLEHYRKIIPTLPNIVPSGGWFICEIGNHQETEVASLLGNIGFHVHELRRDLSGIIRCVVANRP
ncbi:MAG: peptide chain release factor N(5)-glutamine methyltransferase [Alphaproteobacteria bacterium]|nr:peptide chain release factor N(5)-glutamine methyltransferase [Alphaproteobacteria bacterium]